MGRRDEEIGPPRYSPAIAGYRMRDLLIAGDPCAALRLLRNVSAACPSRNGAADGRRKTVAAARDDIQARRRKLIDQVKDQSPVTSPGSAHCLNEVKAKDAIVISELGVRWPQLDLTAPALVYGATFFRWSRLRSWRCTRRQARGARARSHHDRGRRLLHVRNPLPIITVGAPEPGQPYESSPNNLMWGRYGSRRLTSILKARPPRPRMPLTELKAVTRLRESRGDLRRYGEKVETAADVMPAAQRALDKVRSGTR